jgi:hypothetical protein
MGFVSPIIGMQTCNAFGRLGGGILHTTQRPIVIVSSTFCLSSAVLTSAGKWPECYSYLDTVSCQPGGCAISTRHYVKAVAHVYTLSAENAYEVCIDIMVKVSKQQ